MLPVNIIIGDLVNIDPDYVSNNHHDEKWLWPLIYAFSYVSCAIESRWSKAETVYLILVQECRSSYCFFKEKKYVLPDNFLNNLCVVTSHSLIPTQPIAAFNHQIPIPFISLYLSFSFLLDPLCLTRHTDMFTGVNWSIVTERNYQKVQHGRKCFTLHW